MACVRFRLTAGIGGSKPSAFETCYQPRGYLDETFVVVARPSWAPFHLLYSGSARLVAT